MQQNQNKIFKDIASLKTIPDGEVFEAGNVWNKLENKISGKKKRKILWIWIAASMIILISVSGIFKLYHSNKLANQIVDIKKQNSSQQITIAKTNNKVNAVISKSKNCNIKAARNRIFIADTLNNAIKTPEIIALDSMPLVKDEQKFVMNTAVQKLIKKRLKIVYASDFVEENDIAKMKQSEKISTAKSLFKVFETPVNKETEENSLLEQNKQQPNKTLMFFKAKPNTTISINSTNENQ